MLGFRCLEGQSFGADTIEINNSYFFKSLEVAKAMTLPWSPTAL